MLTTDAAFELEDKEASSKFAGQKSFIPVADPILGDEEKAALSSVIDSGWITMGERVRLFEETLAKIHHTGDAVAVSSCTAGLHLIMHALGIGPGDEVLVPSMTFVATVNCVLYVGATPVFVDIESIDNPVMAIADAAAKCTSRTRAIVLVHYAGYLSDRSQWRDFAAQRGLMLIEDAAHAAGLTEVGTYGVAAALSFYGNKNITTAEGGAVITSDERLLERIRKMRGHGLTSATFQRHTGANPNYDMTMLGFNYRMDELRAAIGVAQLSRLQTWNNKREFLTHLYRAKLQEHVPDVEIPFARSSKSAYHIMPVILPKDSSRPDIMKRLKDVGIQTTIHYPPAHQFSFYREIFPTVSLPKTEEYGRREVTLPLFPRLDEADIDRIIHAFASSLSDQ